MIVAGADGRVRHANRRARALFDWDGPAAMAERSLSSIPITASLRTRLARDAGPWEDEATVVVRDRTIPVRIAARPIESRGRLPATLVLITDLSDVSTVIAERDLARRNDRAKTRSLHMVAHDMGGPLTILNGYVSLVLDGSIGIQQLEPYLPKLADQLEHMRRLVNVLLDTARLEEGRLELRLEPLDLSRYVEHMVGRMRSPETGA